jgi:DNA helicase-2/ATP-dependent DNA helicase PcrA
MTEPAISALSGDDQKIIAEELAFHERVKQAVRAEALSKAARAPDLNAIKAELIELRDEAITASERDLPSLFQQLYTHHSLAARTYEQKLPDMRAPYFAHVRLIENGKARDILIGYQTFIETRAGVTIIDWRHAALAKVFFNFREGDEFELDLPGRVAIGTLALRRVITFDVGELTGVSGPGWSLVRPRGGAWSRLAGDGVPELTGGAGTAVSVHQFGIGTRARKLPDVSALLDREQYGILNKSDQGALLILGGAGSGKTTVALHRMALLAYTRPRFYQQKHMQVVVPEQGLVRLTERLLGGLGLEDVGVATFDQWVEDQGRHMLKGLPKRCYGWTPSAVVLIKRHPAMLAVVEAYAEILAGRAADKLAFLLNGWHDSVAAEFRQSRGPLVPRLEAMEKRCAELVAAEADPQTQAWRRDTFAGVFPTLLQQAVDVEAARSELYTNGSLLAVLVSASGGQITEKMAHELVRHTRRQFEDPLGGVAEEEVRKAAAVDGAEVEVDDYAGTMDTEDFAVLLNLMLTLHGRVARKGKSITQYAHLVVDEAQDLAPLELRLLGQALGEGASVTIAGDAAQQSDATVVFRGWDDVLAQLEVDAVEEARLKTNYRCPRPVAEFGHHVLGPLAPQALPPSVKDGRPVVRSVFPNEGLAIVAVTEALAQLYSRERLASVAIICENEANARHFYDGLRSTGDVRLVVDGEFDFKPGVDVTDVSQVKGLEFDYVIIPDANANVYPDSPVARRTFHIAVTRAVHQLWVISVGRPAEILP